MKIRIGLEVCDLLQLYETVLKQKLLSVEIYFHRYITVHHPVPIYVHLTCGTIKSYSKLNTGLLLPNRNESEFFILVPIHLLFLNILKILTFTFSYSKISTVFRVFFLVFD